jgi:DNA mismatch repair protein MutL
MTGPRVARLPEDLVNKIAAGEVVERPASVVKELVENAIDAGAGVVQVEIEAGGKSLIRVRDDGSGMARADAELALERHATSKLRTLADLHAIASHGFRGEALPSIASVSHLVLRTRDEGSVGGTEVEVRHGQRDHVRDVGHPRGTSVEARDLFGGVPARRKFLRADSTEAGHVAEAVTLLALARPGIGFFLKSGGRPVLESPAVETLGARIFQAFGDRFLRDLVPVEGGEEWARVAGFVSRADGPRPPRPSLRLFVNHRPVRDRALAKAVSEAYRRAGAGDRGMEAVLFVDVPPHVVDVNVHPAKTEIRFADARTVWVAVEGAVRAALAGGVRRAPRADTARVEAAVQTFLAGGTTGTPAFQRSSGSWAPLPPSIVAEASLDAPGDAVGSAVANGRARSEIHREGGLDEEPEILGQHRQIYIVASDGEDLILVDQHTAHERVRFEALLARADKRAVEVQMLLTPIVLSLPPVLRPVLEAHAESLTELGYDVEGFGGGSLRVRAVPALLGARDPGQALERILRDLLEREASDWQVTGSRERLAATLACHSAVRAGQSLPRESQAAIVRDLRATQHSTLCPHGRPTMVRIPRDDVSRWFGRAGWKRR